MSRSKAKSNYKISLPEAMSTDESKKETGKKSLYHDRLPSIRPKCVGVVPAAYQRINLWARITSFGHTEAVIYHQNLTSDGYRVIIRENIAPFVEQHRPITIMQDNASSHTAAESIFYN